MKQVYYDFEKNHLKNKEDSSYLFFYSNLDSDKNSKFLIETVNSIKTNADQNLLKKIGKLTSFLNNTPYDNWDDFYIYYIGLFVTKHYTEFIDTKEKYYLNSDVLINKLAKSLELLNIYLEKIYDRKIEINSRESRLLMASILIILSTNNILKENVIWNGKGKTLKFYFPESELDISTTFNINFKEFKLYYRNKSNVYLIGEHFSLIYEVFKINHRSGKSFNLSSKSPLLNSIKNNWVYLSQSQLKKIYELTLEELNINENDIKKEFLDLMNEIKKATKRHDLNLVSTLSSSISPYYRILKLKNLLSLNLEGVKVYLPFKIDFRGRIYWLSDISPTNYKEMRYCLHWGKYEDFEYKDHVFNKLTEQILDKQVNLIKLLKNFKIPEKRSVQHGVLWLLIALAEPFKTSMGKEIRIDEFITKGAEIFNNYEQIKTSLDLEKKIKIIYYINILNEINNDVYIKWLINKDATASCYQHLLKCLGTKNMEWIRKCNMESDDAWYDTYKFIIDDFFRIYKNKLSTKELTLNVLEELFSRTNLKRVMMTENYGCSLRTAWEYFLENIRKWQLTPQQLKELRYNFVLFYKYLSQDTVSLAHNSKTINNMISKELKTQFYDDSISNLEYYKSKIRQCEFRYNKKRYTKQEVFLTNILDKKKLNQAARANYIQSIDACLVRWFLEQEHAITIHDCFMIDYLNTTFLISKINEGMRIIFHDLNLDHQIDTNRLFSIFIII